MYRITKDSEYQSNLEKEEQRWRYHGTLYIPNYITHTIIKNESFGIIKDDNNIFEDCIYVYKNLPRELFNIVSTDCETLSYNTNENIFYSHSKTNQFKLNLLCKDIAENGFYTPIQLMVMNDGTIIPYNSNKRFIIGVYLNAPSIPVCLLYNKSNFDNSNFHYIHENKNANEEIYSTICNGEGRTGVGRLGDTAAADERGCSSHCIRLFISSGILSAEYK